jgi:hypothetical protein
MTSQLPGGVPPADGLATAVAIPLPITMTGR